MTTKYNYMERFTSKIEKTDTCWIWTAGLRGKTGYGAFKIKYTVERERSALDIASSNAIPDERSNFRFSLTGWVLESLDPERGETLEQALNPNSEFMKIIGSLDTNQTAVTFCVYPDSFIIYRRMRDLLHERNIVVAGRPLNFDAPIAMSVKKGTASRGQ